MFKKMIDWFEDGDLVPLAVVISVAHYGPVLMAHGEFWVVAWAVGVMIDLLHFRSVRYAFSSRVWLAGLVAAATTVMAMGYHLRFYDGDWLLAAPIPVGIAILAWHASEKERGVVDGKLSVVNGELQGLRKELAALAERLQERESDLQEREGALQVAERRAQAAERHMKEVERDALAMRAAWKKLGPLGQDIYALVTGGGITQAEIASKHGISESKVSRLKADLNGGG